MVEIVRSSQLPDNAERSDSFVKEKNKTKEWEAIKKGFKGKKFDDLSESDRSDLLKAVAIRLGLIEG